MKILLLCNKLPYPTNDGSSIAIARMIEGFVDASAQVTALCLNTVKHRKDPQKIPSAIKKNVHFEIVEVNTNPTRRNAFANLFQKLPFHVSRFYQKEVADKLLELLQSTPYDVVQLEGIFMMPYFRLIRDHSHAKIALRTHNVEHQIWERAIPTAKPVLRAFLKNQTKKLKRYEHWCAKEVDAVVAISENDARYFKVFNKKIIAIPCGIQRVTEVKNVNNRSFFHLGAMDWLPNQQGVEWLLDNVWPLVLEKDNTLALHLAGRAMSHEFAKRSVPGVTIHGEVEDATAFRKNHGIMLVPLLAGSGIRIKIIEGLAEGLPIISTKIGAQGIPGTPGENILLAKSEEEFAESILLLANNPEKCRAIGKNAALLATENFMNKNLANRLLAFYNGTW